TTDAVKRAARISVNEEDLRPRSVREYRAPLAMVAAALGDRGDIGRAECRVDGGWGKRETSSTVAWCSWKSAF
ncbi:unnamed protein product, partial [Musa hybrid cultivar]